MSFLISYRVLIFCCTSFFIYRCKDFTFTPRLEVKETIQYTVEGDWSGAAFLLVAGAIAGPITVKCLQMNSTQADKAVMQALIAANASIVIDHDEITIGANEEGL